jgi:8-oxo-dGTP pyrophosphatase MutT (NUDIX family)
MLDDARQTIGVSGVVTNATGEVLLIKTEHAGWELPGGRVERGEDLFTALQREVREEASCQVTVGRLVGVSSHTGSAGQLQFTFLCSHASGRGWSPVKWCKWAVAFPRAVPRGLPIWLRCCYLRRLLLERLQHLPHRGLTEVVPAD